jgi:hypothetical protein
MISRRSEFDYRSALAVFPDFDSSESAWVTRSDDPDKFAGQHFTGLVIHRQPRTVQAFEPVQKLMELDFSVIVPNLNGYLELEQVPMHGTEIRYIVRSQRIPMQASTLKRDHNLAGD